MVRHSPFGKLKRLRMRGVALGQLRRGASFDKLRMREVGSRISGQVYGIECLGARENAHELTARKAASQSGEMRADLSEAGKKPTTNPSGPRRASTTLRALPVILNIPHPEPTPPHPELVEGRTALPRAAQDQGANAARTLHRQLPSPLNAERGRRSGRSPLRPSAWKPRSRTR